MPMMPDLNRVIEQVSKEKGIDRNIIIDVSLDVKELIIQENYQPTYGARPLRRAIQKHIADPLSEAILKGKFKDSQKITVVLKNGVIELQEEEASVLA